MSDSVADAVVREGTAIAATANVTKAGVIGALISAFGSQYTLVAVSISVAIISMILNAYFQHKKHQREELESARNMAREDEKLELLREQNNRDKELYARRSQALDKELGN
jgi:hypothetical protein